MTGTNLMELYNITLEELRHYRTIYVQSFISLGIIAPIFLASIAYLFGDNSPILKDCVNFVKWAIFILLILVLAFYFWTLRRYDSRIKKSIRVMRNIETKIRTEKPDANGLLIGEALNKK